MTSKELSNGVFVDMNLTSVNACINTVSVSESSIGAGVTNDDTL